MGMAARTMGVAVMAMAVIVLLVVGVVMVVTVAMIMDMLVVHRSSQAPSSDLKSSMRRFC